MNFDIVMCQDIFGGIGRDGSVPWKNPEEMASFKNITTWTPSYGQQNAVIMGRKTWESLPEGYRPLPNRYNIVLSRDPDYSLGDASAVLCGSLDEALLHLDPLHSSHQIFWAYVIGGAELYREALMHPSLQLVQLSVLRTGHDCDVFVDLPSDLQEISRVQATSYTSLLLKRQGV